MVRMAPGSPSPSGRLPATPAWPQACCRATPSLLALPKTALRLHRFRALSTLPFRACGPLPGPCDPARTVRRASARVRRVARQLRRPTSDHENGQAFAVASATGSRAWPLLRQPLLRYGARPAPQGRLSCLFGARRCRTAVLPGHLPGPVARQLRRQAPCQEGLCGEDGPVKRQEPSQHSRPTSCPGSFRRPSITAPTALRLIALGHCPVRRARPQELSGLGLCCASLSYTCQARLTWVAAWQPGSSVPRQGRAGLSACLLRDGAPPTGRVVRRASVSGQSHIKATTNRKSPPNTARPTPGLGLCCTSLSYTG